MDASVLGFRVPRACSQIIVAGALRINLDRQCVRVNGEVARLTPFEYRCLVLLARGRGEAVTKDMFLRELYPDGEEAELKIVDVFICKLRRKLRLLGAPDAIGTLWGRGYVLR